MNTRYCALIASILVALPLTAIADVTGTTGGSVPQPTIQPSLGITYMIRTTGAFDDLAEVGMFAGNFVPDGWSRCDGSMLSIQANTSLFSLIGTTYGGDGQTTFALPNLLGRTVIGAGQGPGLTNRTLGESDGSDNVQLTVSNLPPDAHSLPGGGTTGITGSGTPYSNMQASLALNFLMPTSGVFPSRDALPGSASPAIAGSEPLLGTVHITASNEIPSGFVLAAGQTLPIQQNAAIFSILGTTYGGNGQSNFQLPNLQGRAAIGVGTSRPGLSPQLLGQTEGSESLTLSVSQLPPHVHTLPGGGVTGVEGGGLPQTNMQPTLGLHYIIALEGIFPSHGGGSGVDSSDVTPLLGQIELFTGNFAPDGWDFCDGQTLSIQQNTALFSLLGIQYGGNGQSTFQLPDLDGSLAVGAGQGAGLMNWGVGQFGGTETNTLTIDQMPAHDHALATPEPGSLAILGVASMLLARRKRI